MTCCARWTLRYRARTPGVAVVDLEDADRVMAFKTEPAMVWLDEGAAMAEETEAPTARCQKGELTYRFRIRNDRRWTREGVEASKKGAVLPDDSSAAKLGARGDKLARAPKSSFDITIHAMQECCHIASGNILVRTVGKDPVCLGEAISDSSTS